MSAFTEYKPHLIVIVGPTGSGKSDLAVQLASRLNAPIISTDSRQTYKGMRIGTAQPTEEQLRAVPHHFIADRLPTERFSCADFEQEALVLLEKLFNEQRLAHPERRPSVVAVGGSGLYIDALCNGLDPLPDTDPELRNNLTEKLSQEGLEPLLQLLKEKDPATFETIDRQNPARVLRAVEVCLATGKPFSEQRRSSSLHAGEKSPRPFDVTKIGIDLPRPELYARIDARVDAMMTEGLEAEARTLHHLKHLPSLQTVGYRELFDHFDNLYTDEKGAPLPAEKNLARAIELIKRNSRRYAKRQMTWFRRDPDIRWLANPADIESLF
jgi:tRNA dimethylallyltransferase